MHIYIVAGHSSFCMHIEMSESGSSYSSKPSVAKRNAYNFFITVTGLGLIIGLSIVAVMIVCILIIILVAVYKKRNGKVLSKYLLV